MTDREKAIVMAHTGVCMLAGEKFGVFHAYIEDIMGRPVYTHELAIQSISDEIKEKSQDDFIKLCKEEQEPCEDAISRSDMIDAVGHGTTYTSEELQNIIKALPPVNAQPKLGHWIFDEMLDKHYYCSECKSMGVDYWDYCPYCGAKMIEPQERSDKEC